MTRTAERPRLFVGCVAVALTAGVGAADLSADPRRPASLDVARGDASAATPTLAQGYLLLYSGRYDEAAAVALAVRTIEPADLAAYELRSTALHFQIRREMGDSTDRRRALASCPDCPALLSQFFSETAEGRRLSRARLQARPDDDSATFFLGKLDLNYLWLQLGTLDRRTGWNEYWEARRSLDALLSRNPTHVRARVARAWMEYVVDTRLPWGTKWLMGGGDRRRALLAVRAAAEAESDVFAQTEAAFALWEMLVRERRIQEAIDLAQQLVRNYPDNQDLARFLRRHDARPTL